MFYERRWKIVKVPKRASKDSVESIPLSLTSLSVIKIITVNGRIKSEWNGRTFLLLVFLEMRCYFYFTKFTADGSLTLINNQLHIYCNITITFLLLFARYKIPKRIHVDNLFGSAYPNSLIVYYWLQHKEIGNWFGIT